MNTPLPIRMRFTRLELFSTVLRDKINSYQISDKAAWSIYIKMCLAFTKDLLSLFDEVENNAEYRERALLLIKTYESLNNDFYNLQISMTH
jgi:hypothetical protein